ncbi:signal peptidase I [Enterococcus sp. HY326]|uniref:signal peptidase I n=1 Tax=Enterococcus sp. HY326 TaxID=2971265 RepID=UPI0022402F2B|nr:signal peptidase I [Enterococcus sp. HY326]
MRLVKIPMENKKKLRKRPKKSVGSAKQHKTKKINSSTQIVSKKSALLQTSGKAEFRKSKGEEPLACPQRKTRKKGKRFKPQNSLSKKKQVGRSKQRFKELLLVFSMTLITCLFVSSFLFEIYRVNGYSMVPTLRDRDLVLLKKNKSVQRFDLVLIKRGNTYQIRRVIGLPKEDIQYINDSLYVNGEMVVERFLINQINEAQQSGGNFTKDFNLIDISGASKIPEEAYFVLADNREYSSDSRDYGLVSENQIIGVITINFSDLKT